MHAVNFPEILIVNGIGIFLMVFLRLTRIENIEKRYVDDKYFDTMIWLTIAGCTAEVFAFLIDGKIFMGCRVLSYLLNSFCFIGTCCVGFLWCLFVEFRVHHDVERSRKRAKILVIPFLVDIVMNLVNYTGCGILFSISEENVYQRGYLVVVTYLILFFYFGYSLCIVDRSKKSGLHIQFFTVNYFVIPCILGTVVQGVCYGITLGWTTVAIAMLCVHVQTQSMNAFVDSLSGLYNRRYMDCVLSRIKRNSKAPLYGIMIDVNDFKKINDDYGHSKGDDAIHNIGRILYASIPDNGIAIRYAGDEFIILLRTDDAEVVRSTMRCVEKNTEEFNRAKKEPYSLSFAMGYSRFEQSTGNVEQFLSSMDMEMYLSKRKHYEQAVSDRRQGNKE